MYVIINSFTYKCQIHKSYFLYFFIVSPSVFIFGCYGFLISTITKRNFMKFLYFLLFIFVVVIHSAVEGYIGPNNMPHNIILGLVTISAVHGFDNNPIFLEYHYLLFRLVSISIGFVFLSLAMLRTKPKGHFLKTFSIEILIVSLIFLLFALFLRDDFGLSSRRGRLNKELNKIKETEHFIMHYSDKSDRIELERAILVHEWYYTIIDNILNLKSDKKLESYIYPDKDTMYKYTMARGFYFAIPWRREIHLQNTSSRILLHEMVHSFSSEFGIPILKISCSVGLSEGIAVAIEGGMVNDKSAHREVAAALRSKKIPTAKQIASNFGFAINNMYKAYESAGSFVGFLVMKYGAEKFKRLYVSRNFKKIYGKSIERLDEEWKSFLNKIEVSEREKERMSERFDDTCYPPFYKEKCPRLGSYEMPLYKEADDFYERGFYKLAYKKYDDLSKKDENPELLLKKVKALWKLKRSEEALNILNNLKERKLSFRMYIDVMHQFENYYIEHDKYERAKDFAEEVIKIEPENIESLMKSELIKEYKDNRDFLNNIFKYYDSDEKLIQTIYSLKNRKVTSVLNYIIIKIDYGGAICESDKDIIVKLLAMDNKFKALKIDALKSIAFRYWRKNDFKGCLDISKKLYNITKETKDRDEIEMMKWILENKEKYL